MLPTKRQKDASIMGRRSVLILITVECIDI
jgi:hypothetical protein